MYSVVGCGECGSLWIVEGDPKTTVCRRCGKRHRFASLRKLARADDRHDARAARSALLAERATDHGPAAIGGDGAIPDPAEGNPPGSTGATGGDGGSRGAIVRRAIRTLEAPTADEIVAYAADRGVEEAAAGRVLEGLVRDGEAMEADGRYRLL